MNMVAASADDSITNTAVAAAISSTNTLGPRVLRKLVQKASIQNIHTHTLDLGGIVWLEHVNLVVGDMSTATKFYIDFLGMTSEREANPKSNHFNLGQQQFHLAAVEKNNVEQRDWPQRVTGSIGLCVPSLSRIRERLDRAQSELRGTLFSVVEEDTNTMTATCPWGNVIHLYDVLIDEEYCPSSSKGAGSSQQKMVVQHEEGGVYGPHRMAVRGNPGIRFVEIACAVGTIDAIAEFYETLLGCQVTRRTTTEEDPSSNDANEMQVAIVSVGPGVHMVFAEQKNLTRECMKLMEGVHICIYIPNFQRSYNTLHERSLIWTNPRFTHLDSCDTLPEAAASRTFRFKDIIDLRTGEKILELEHETRSMLHGQYMKVPPYFPN
jgi:catechol-2,3-dioxygenase